jgi:hypothetical protein
MCEILIEMAKDQPSNSIISEREPHIGCFKQTLFAGHFEKTRCAFIASHGKLLI